MPMAAAMPSLIFWTCLPACLPDRLFNIRYLFFFADMPSCRWPRPFLLSSLGPACLPAGRIALDLSVSLSVCRHADGRGHAFSSPEPSCLPACRIAFFDIKYLFFLCRHAVMPMAAAISSLICWNCLPACRPDRLFQRHFSLFPNSVLSSPVPCRHAGCWTASAEPSVSHPAPACRHARRGSHALCISSGAGMPACRTW